MKRKKVDIIWLIISVACFLLVSISILLMPIVSTTNPETLGIMRYVPGLMFWIFLAGGIITQIVLAVRRRKWFTLSGKDPKTGERIGLISFFACPLAGFFDVIAAVSLVCFAVSIFISGGYLALVFMAVLVFSFSMHCILNGKIYYHILSREA